MNQPNDGDLKTTKHFAWVPRKLYMSLDIVWLCTYYRVHRFEGRSNRTPNFGRGWVKWREYITFKTK